jgi:poly(3-hydroxybutyrate) depolymerase
MRCPAFCPVSLLRPLLTVALAVAALTLAAPGAARAESGFLDRRVAIDGTVYDYQVHVPRTFDRQRKWPVVLFLHGSGERGDDGLAQTQVGLPATLRKRREAFPAIVVMPQARAGATWNDPVMERVALRALDEAIVEWNGDPERLTLTGLSMGGYGTLNLAFRYPELFAGLMPICGGVTRFKGLPSDTAAFPAEGAPDPFAAVAKVIGRTPIWIFHGDQDRAVSVEESRRLAAALAKMDKSQATYTEFPGVGHDSWTRAYDDPKTLPWLLAQRMKKQAPPVADLTAPTGRETARFTLLDATYRHEGGSHDRAQKMNPAAPADWARPVDYAGGRARLRLEVRSKPNPHAKTLYLVCFIQRQDYTCSPYVRFRAPGVYTWEVPLASFWQSKKKYDFSRKPAEVHLIVKDANQVNLDRGNPFAGAPDLSLYLPLDVRAHVEIVAR